MHMQILNRTLLSEISSLVLFHCGTRLAYNLMYVHGKRGNIIRVIFKNQYGVPRLPHKKKTKSPKWKDPDILKWLDDLTKRSVNERPSASM